jgi:predicted nucleic acid-binding protein
MANAIMVFKAEDYLKHGFDIAVRENITVYDATYIALTERKRCNTLYKRQENNITLLKSM